MDQKKDNCIEEKEAGNILILWIVNMTCVKKTWITMVNAYYMVNAYLIMHPVYKTIHLQIYYLNDPLTLNI